MYCRYSQKNTSSNECEKAEQIYKKLISIDNSEFNRKNLGFLYYRMKEFGKTFRIFMTMPDPYFLDNMFITTMINSAKTENEMA